MKFNNETLRIAVKEWLEYGKITKKFYDVTMDILKKNNY